MDDLTTRALQNQSNANANYNSKQQREEAQKALTEAPAFVTGFEGGKYAIERLGQDPVATGVPMTNGLLEVGRRVTTTGQYVDGMPRVKPATTAQRLETITPGIVMWLDCNWFDGDYVDVATSFPLFYALIKFFKASPLYTLTNEYPLYNSGNDSLLNPSLAANLSEANIRVVQAPIATAAQRKGTFFLPMLESAFIFSAADLSNLRKIAKTNGLMICGERSSWKDYDNRLLRGLGVRETVVAEIPPQPENGAYRTTSSKLPDTAFPGGGNCLFSGLEPSEVLVKNARDEAIFAFLRAA